MTRAAVTLLLLLSGAACTETPTDIPPCVLPSDDCPVPDAAATSDVASVDGGPTIVAPDAGVAD